MFNFDLFLVSDFLYFSLFSMYIFFFSLFVSNHPIVYCLVVEAVLFVNVSSFWIVGGSGGIWMYLFQFLTPVDSIDFHFVCPFLYVADLIVQISEGVRFFGDLKASGLLTEQHIRLSLPDESMSDLARTYGKVCCLALLLVGNIRNIFSFIVFSCHRVVFFGYWFDLFLVMTY